MYSLFLKSKQIVNRVKTKLTDCCGGGDTFHTNEASTIVIGLVVAGILLGFFTGFFQNQFLPAVADRVMGWFNISQ